LIKKKGGRDAVREWTATGREAPLLTFETLKRAPLLGGVKSSRKENQGGFKTRYLSLQEGGGARHGNRFKQAIPTWRKGRRKNLFIKQKKTAQYKRKGEKKKRKHETPREEMAKSGKKGRPPFCNHGPDPEKKSPHGKRVKIIKRRLQTTLRKRKRKKTKGKGNRGEQVKKRKGEHKASKRKKADIFPKRHTRHPAHRFRRKWKKKKHP